MRTIDEIIQQIEDEKGKIEFLPTGFPKLDEMLDGGFMRKELVILGGFTGLGKSYVAGQLLWNIATAGYRTAYLSLEISDTMVVSRLVGSLSNIKPTRIIKGFLTAQEKELADNAKAEVIAYSKLIDIYDDVYDLDKIEKIIREGKYHFVVVDFIQNVISRGDEYERMSAVSLRLQQMAKESSSCVLALSQLSNSAAKTKDVEYKGSGSIAMVADLGFFLARDENGMVKLYLRKNRRGFSGCEFNLQFDMPGGRIHEVE